MEWKEPNKLFSKTVYRIFTQIDASLDLFICFYIFIGIHELAEKLGFTPLFIKKKWKVSLGKTKKQYL